MGHLIRGSFDSRYLRIAGYDIVQPPGAPGADLGICDPNHLPIGMQELPGTRILGHPEFGNYQFADGSIMCYRPRRYYKYGTGNNGLAVNRVSIVPWNQFSSVTEANDNGYAVPRWCYDGGELKRGVFVDKYMASKNVLGSGYVASSIKNGNPLSTAADHNPIGGLTACAGNFYYEAINAAHARDGFNGEVNPASSFFVLSRFLYADMALFTLAHAQAVASLANCAWYDDAAPFPKGCNNNALRDANDTSVLYVSDGYSNCGKTGSGMIFAKTTHNGADCGIADLNGLMWEVSLGITYDAAQSKFFTAKQDTAMKDFTPGNSGATDHWGAVGIAAMMEEVSIPDFSPTSEWKKLGNGANQVLSEDSFGSGWLLTALGLPRDLDGQSASGTVQFGNDGFYWSLRDGLCLLSCAGWSNALHAGPWAAYWGSARSYSSYDVGLRAACYPD